MPFVVVPDLTGKVYVPEQNPDRAQKHPCPDCHTCQMCAESRCRVCRNRQQLHKKTSQPGLKILSTTSSAISGGKETDHE